MKRPEQTKIIASIPAMARGLIGSCVILLVTASAPFAQLSPGDLAEPHAELEGLSNCTSCHELGEGPSSAKCLECHKGIKRAIDSKTGYHAREASELGKNCMECHSDHAGREFELVRWPGSEKQFDHTLTGYNLEGAHGRVICRDCHNPANIKDELLTSESSVDISQTYLGLATNCLSCHIDEHRGQLGDDCLKCHSQDKFRPVANFDHQKSRFPLVGKHRQVDCAKCHKPIVGPEAIVRFDSSYVKFTGINSAKCDDCHKDVHKGKYQKACSSCHSVEGWKKIAEGGFNHNATDFPLLGRHVKVDCEKCHKTKAYLDKIKHDQCTDCHQDIHFAQFANRPDQGKCESCHNVDGFLPAVYSISDHNQSVFPLTGAHLAQPCVYCHKVDSTSWAKPARLFRVAHTACTDCHRDIHASQFATSDPIKQCTDCHNNQQWHLPNFNHDQNTSYKLVGAHTKVRCEACHKPTPGESSYTLYRYVSRTCAGCHANPESLGKLEGTDS